MIELTGILPRDLKETFQNSDYDITGNLAIRAIKYHGNDLYFDFSLSFNDGERGETQLWRLEVKDCQYSKIDQDYLGEYFSFYSSHFLLWEFTDNQTELYFKKLPENPEKLFAAIYTIHNTVFDSYIALETFINGNNLLKLCEADFGLFARGPKRILKYYFHCLEKENQAPYYYGDYALTRWDGEKTIPEDRTFKLAILGGIYFIGQDFNFRRLDKQQNKSGLAQLYLRWVRRAKKGFFY